MDRGKICQHDVMACAKVPLLWVYYSVIIDASTLQGFPSNKQVHYGIHFFLCIRPNILAFSIIY